jgi:hypothetical protein
VLLLVPALVMLARRGKTDTEAATEGPSPRSILGAVDAELEAIKGESRGGWTPELASRALKALRLAASCALRRDVAHEAVSGPAGSTGAASADGRLLVSHGVLRRRQAAVSSAVTAAEVNRAIINLPLTEPHERRQSLEGLRQALSDLTTSLYGSTFNVAPLDAALENGRAAARGLRRK